MADNVDMDRIDVDAEAFNLMAQGKRHYLVQDYNSAVQALEEACKLLDGKYGISADECADTYLSYGKSLLELHRQESGALDGLVGNPKADTDAEDEEEEAGEEIGDEEEELKADESKKEENGNKTVNEEDISISPTPQTSSTTSSTIPTTVVESNGNTATKDEQQNNSNGNSSTIAVAGSTSSLNSSITNNQMETDVDPNQPSTSTGITDENRTDVEDEDDQPSNIEVAFEVLSMAKKIYQRQIEYRDDAHLKLAESQQTLGEIFIEWENNQQALEELNECLEIRKRHLPDDDRLIAEAYYHIGLTHSLNENIEEANLHFKKAVDVIEERLTKLKKMYTGQENDEQLQKIQIEVKELELVLPEMKAKIEDSQDQMSSGKLASVTEESEKLEEEKIAEKKKQILTKPISNVTHLVKRKREVEETDSIESNGNSKKLKNGNENGCENGNSNSTTTTTDTTNNVECDKV